MKFKVDVKSGVWARAGMALLAMGALASCGGGTQIDSFEPHRVLAFGDEASVILDSGDHNGSKYAVNALVYDTKASPVVPVVPNKLDCGASPIWSQYVASSYGMVFPECNASTSGAPPNSRILAQAGATVDGVVQQVSDFIAGNTFSTSDLVTVMAGANDVRIQYEAFKAGSIDKATALAALDHAGTELGSQVVRITDAGAKVLIATLPDIGLSPYARVTGNDAAVLTELTKNFNKALGLRLEDVKNGGRAAGLVQAYDIVLNMSLNGAAYGLINVADSACLAANSGPALPTCTDLTLQPASTSLARNTWMWADDLNYGSTVHAQLGASAASRAHNNPF